MNYSPNFRLRRVLVLSLFLCSFLTFSYKGYAQVIIGCIDDGGAAWTIGPCLNVTIAPNCVFKVCICTRVIDPGGSNITEISIRSIEKVDVSGCTGISWQNVIPQVVEILSEDLTTGIPDCSSGTWKMGWTIITSMCWEVINSAGPMEEPIYACRPCPDATGFCHKRWKYCRESDGSITSVLVHNTFSSPSCELEPPAFDWEPGVCYTITVCE